MTNPIKLTQEDIETAFDNMAKAEELLGDAIIIKGNAKEALSVAAALYTAQGLDGTNAETRKADLTQKTAEAVDTVRQADIRLIKAKVAHAVAKAAVDKVKYLIRFGEISVHAASNGSPT